MAVEQAVRQGRPVPAEVLAEYPRLAALARGEPEEGHHYPPPKLEVGEKTPNELDRWVENIYTTVSAFRQICDRPVSNGCLLAERRPEPRPGRAAWH
jgi:hypothetical protein